PGGGDVRLLEEQLAVSASRSIVDRLEEIPEDLAQPGEAVSGEDVRDGEEIRRVEGELHDVSAVGQVAVPPEMGDQRLGQPGASVGQTGTAGDDDHGQPRPVQDLP